MSADATTMPATLPSDAVLVHVGMHKTGTTAMQSVLASLREALAREGVLYPGESEVHHLEARALTQRTLGWQSSPVLPPEPEVWDEFAELVRGTSSRVVISSEFLSGASEAQIRRLLEDLGPERVHILIGVRNFGPVAVSSWQQTLKQGRVSTLDGWLKSDFQRSDPSDTSVPFWAKFDPAPTIARWSGVVGPDRVTVIVVRDSDRSLLPTAFERLLGLPEGRLAGQRVPRSNRGLTAIEAEAIRRVNIELRGRLEWPEYESLVRNGAIRRMVELRSPGPEGPRPELPAWVAGQVTEEGRRLAEMIRASGVHVVGELGDLSVAPTTAGPGAGTAPDLSLVPLDAMVEAVVGAVASAVFASWTMDGERPDKPPRIGEFTAARLAAIIATRGWNRALRLVHLREEPRPERARVPVKPG